MRLSLNLRSYRRFVSVISGKEPPGALNSYRNASVLWPPRASSGGLPISSDSESIRRRFSMDSTRMAKKEENGESFLEASPGLCLDLPRRNV